MTKRPRCTVPAPRCRPMRAAVASTALYMAAEQKKNSVSMDVCAASCASPSCAARKATTCSCNSSSRFDSARGMANPQAICHIRRAERASAHCGPVQVRASEEAGERSRVTHTKTERAPSAIQRVSDVAMGLPMKPSPRHSGSVPSGSNQVVPWIMTMFIRMFTATMPREITIGPITTAWALRNDSKMTNGNPAAMPGANQAENVPASWDSCAPNPSDVNIGSDAASPPMTGREAIAPSTSPVWSHTPARGSFFAPIACEASVLTAVPKLGHIQPEMTSIHTPARDAPASSGVPRCPTKAWSMTSSDSRAAAMSPRGHTSAHHASASWAMTSWSRTPARRPASSSGQ
mmetsp:Transcript_15210/g.57402  ORF Transcript_15210/g.57402 Transcript_15210/m.57402 type:complete len:347 (+) Transcript_15210:818-1858(+)